MRKKRGKNYRAYTHTQKNHTKKTEKVVSLKYRLLAGLLAVLGVKGLVWVKEGGVMFPLLFA